MKNYLIISMLLLLIGCSSVANRNNAAIQFALQEFDFGIVEAKKPAGYDFDFSNTGDVPVIIQEVTTSCGCAVPDWPRQPIKPNKAGVIKVTYDAEFPGRFVKEVRVHYNGKDSPIVLKIKGAVDYPESNGIKTTTVK